MTAAHRREPSPTEKSVPGRADREQGVRTGPLGEAAVGAAKPDRLQGGPSSTSVTVIVSVMASLSPHGSVAYGGNEGSARDGGRLAGACCQDGVMDGGLYR